MYVHFKYFLMSIIQKLVFLFLFQMFDHILTREREVFWQYGDVTCAAFSLKDLDTVSRFSPTIGFIFLCGSREGKKA